MDNENNEYLSNNEIDQNGAAPFSSGDKPQREKKQKATFTRADWINFAAAFALAFYPAIVFSISKLSQSSFLPAIGSALFFLAINIFGVVILGKKCVWTKANTLLFAAACLSSVSLGLWSYWVMQVLSHVAAFVFSVLSLLSLSGINTTPAARPAILGESFVNAFSSAFSHFFLPFSAFHSSLGEKKRSFLGVFIGILICVPLVAVCAVLLASADAVFGEFLENISRNILYINVPRFIYYVLRVGFFTLLIFSIFYSLKNPHPTVKRKREVPNISISISITVLVVLNILYALRFLLVLVNMQFDVLFGYDSYAQYARQGFFELVIVSGINLSTVMTAGYFHPKSISRRVLSFILCAQTAILLVTAALRMCLYISAYGLSFLRVLTFYFMAVIACAIALCIIKDFRPTFKLFPVLFIFASALWISFSITDTGKIIADYNVNAYLKGYTQVDVDIDYLSTLSYSAAPSLRRLAENGTPKDRAEAEEILHNLSHYTPRWYEWCADMLYVQK